MEQKRLDELTHSVLINAGQLAFIEEAAGTLKLLENYSDFFRYVHRKVPHETLYNEVEVLEKYVAVQKVRYGSRFEVDIESRPEYKSTFVEHLSLLDFFDSVLIRVLEEAGEPVRLKIAVEATQTSVVAHMILSDSKGEEHFTKNL